MTDEDDGASAEEGSLKMKNMAEWNVHTLFICSMINSSGQNSRETLVK